MKVTASLITSLSILSSCESPEAALFIEACKDVMAERLETPSTYMAVSHTPISYVPFTVAWSRGWMTPLDEQKDRNTTGGRAEVVKSHILIAEHQEKSGTYFVAKTLINYEASSSSGAMFSDTYKCEMGVDRKVLPKTYSTLDDPRVNGETSWSYSNNKDKKE